METFGLELALNNKDLEMLSYLWEDLKFTWDPKHFSCLLDYILDMGWQLGLNWLLGSATSHLLYLSLNPEDKDQFYMFMKKIMPADMQQVLSQNLSEAPYFPFSFLNSPGFFINHKVPVSKIEIVEI